MARIGRDVGVDRGRASLGQAAIPELVVAAWVERASRIVQVVLVAVDEIRGRRGDLHEVGRVPGAREAQPCSRRREDRRRSARTARRAAFLVLLDEAHDRREAVRESLLVGEIRARTGRKRSAVAAATSASTATRLTAGDSTRRRRIPRREADRLDHPWLLRNRGRSATSPWSGIGGQARRPSSKPCSSSPARQTGSASVEQGRPLPTGTRTSRSARCRWPRRSAMRSGRIAS